MTGTSVIKAAMRLIGVIGEGESPSSSEFTDALEMLNAMLDSWSNDKRKLFNSTVVSLTLTTTTQSYTWGSGGTFNSARPAKVDGAICVIADAGSSAPATDKVRIPLDLIQDAATWAAIRSQTAKNTFPEKVFVDGAFPQRTVRFWPIPTFAGTAPAVEFWIWAVFVAFADLTTAYTFPPGYELVFKTNLAILLAPEYGRKASPELLLAAKESLDGVMSMSPDTLPSMLLAQQQASGAPAQ